MTALKKFLIFLILSALILFFAGCSEEHGEPVVSEDEINSGVSEEPSEQEKTPEEIAEACGYMSFKEITAAGYYPDWMQPHTIIIYDENGIPEIAEGGELLPENLVGRPEFEAMPFLQFSEEMKIEPNTKAEYDLHGFIQNIYHLWPDGNYNLDYPLEEHVDPKTFMTFEEITSFGCYPVWMKPNTVIVYDENGNPEIIEGGVLTEEDCAKDEMYSEIGFIELNDKTYRIKPNTKVEYFKDGFIQNIYFRWPDGSYNLSPLSQTENAKITYYATIEDWENKSGETVVLSEYQCHSVFWIFDGMNLLPESTSKPMDFPRYEITFTYVGTEHCIYVDSNNVFTFTMLGGGNYVSTFNEDHFSKTEELFNEAK